MNKEEWKKLLKDDKKEVKKLLKKIHDSEIFETEFDFYEYGGYRSPEEELDHVRNKLKNELSTSFPKPWFNYVIENLNIWIGYSTDYEDEDSGHSAPYFEHSPKNLEKTKKLVEIQKLTDEYNKSPHDTKFIWDDDDHDSPDEPDTLVDVFSYKTYECHTDDFDDLMARLDGH